jgi:murein DD-endopeptidase MepM/ murein hydrolase activator NlpD
LYAIKQNDSTLPTYNKMKKTIKKITFSLTIMLAIFSQSCQKKETSDNDTANGGGTIACSYPQLTAVNLPTFSWVLEGVQQDYQSYSTNTYFKFRSPWLSAPSYLCGGERQFHTAWDIHRPNLAQINGKKVYAAYGGTVKAVYNAGSGFAQGITIEHLDLIGNKFTTNYTHVDPLASLQGQSVTAGQQIGYVADLADDDHLHFSLRKAPYSNISNKGALPKYLNDNNCSCGGDPVFPEYFVDPGILTFQDRGSITPTRIINLTGNLSFGNVIVNTTSSKPMTITNNGNSTLTISSLNLPNGYSSDYNSGTIPAGNSTTANITFSPQNAVTIYNGNITVNSNSTSGANTIVVSGSGVNGTPPSPSFNPSVNSFTSCSFGFPTQSGTCIASQYIGGTIRMKVSSYNQSSNTINFTIEKCSGSFSNSGTAYLKQGDYCGNVVTQTNYPVGTSSISMSVSPPIAAGQYKYTAVLISATTDKFYTLSITVQY